MNDYATVHPRLEVVAIVTERTALDAMRRLAARDASWGEMGINEMVYLGRAKDKRPRFSYYGTPEDCEHRATIQQVIAEVHKRREQQRNPRRIVQRIISAIIPRG